MPTQVRLVDCPLLFEDSFSTRPATEIISAVLTCVLFLLGDLGYYDNNGRFYYVDRIKDVIKCHTFYVSPTELEDILLTHEAVQEACVVGVPNPIRGDDTTAFVVLYDSYIPSNNLADTLKILVEGKKYSLPSFCFIGTHLFLSKCASILLTQKTKTGIFFGTNK